MDVLQPFGGQDVGDILGELRAINVEVDHEVIRIGPRTWAIHGCIAYDGEVIAATFASEDDAWAVLFGSREYTAPARRRPVSS